MLSRPTIRTLVPGIAACLAAPAAAQFTTFQGNAAVESSWRAAAGGGGAVPREDFEGFRGTPSPFSGPSDPVMALPALGIIFQTDVPGAWPGVYADANFAHSGINQL